VNPTDRATNRNRVALPEPSLRLEQDAEWCLVEMPDGWREFRFHDYEKIYEVPGLYEKIFYDILECDSPTRIRRMLVDSLRDLGRSISDLRVLDLGAGNGLVGAELASVGVETIVGVDIVESAREAAERDRPGIYADYFIVDMTDLSDEDFRRLERFRFNCLTCVAALGFGDIPPEAFVQAYRLIEVGGCVAFNIKKRFLEDEDSSGFSEMVRTMIEEGVLEVFRKTTYPHRLSTAGDPLDYVAIIGAKRAEVTDTILAS